MSKTKIIIAIASVMMLFTTACKKNGTGGKATIKGYVAHHEKKIPNATVYIKYGAKEFPGEDVSKYDANIAADATGYFEIKNLLKGDYYVYGVGYDSGISEIVQGGLPIKLRNKEVVETTVAVVE